MPAFLCGVATGERRSEFAEGRPARSKAPRPVREDSASADRDAIPEPRHTIDKTPAAGLPAGNSGGGERHVAGVRRHAAVGGAADHGDGPGVVGVGAVRGHETARTLRQEHRIGGDAGGIGNLGAVGGGRDGSVAGEGQFAGLGRSPDGARRPYFSMR